MAELLSSANLLSYSGLGSPAASHLITNDLGLLEDVLKKMLDPTVCLTMTGGEPNAPITSTDMAKITFIAGDL